MPEIKETLKIFKARWPEATLILFLNFLWTSIYNLKFVIDHKFPEAKLFLYLSVFLLILAETILLCGFLRTIYLGDNKPQTLLSLLKTGKHFFWRIFAFSILIGLAYFILYFLAFRLIYTFRYHSETLYSIYQWIMVISSIFASCILIKLTFFITPVIIVLDCSLFQSWKLLKKIRLLDAKQLLFLFVISIFLIFINRFLPYYPYITCWHTFWYTFLKAMHLLALGFVNLTISVAALRFVASLNLVYDNQQVNSGLQEPRQ